MNRPKVNHYTIGNIECIDFILDKKLDHCRGSAIKYIVRAGHKDDEIGDLQKAIDMLEFEIEDLKERKEEDDKINEIIIPLNKLTKTIKAEDFEG